jgi:hypothetical protein
VGRTISEWRQRLRTSMGPSLFTGVTRTDWRAFLRRHRSAIDPPYRGRAICVSVASVVNSVFRQVEEQTFGPQVMRVKIGPPLFILGHRRSGTTLLYNLITTDRRFAYPNVYQVSFPHTFLATEGKFSPLLAAIMPRKRPPDNMLLGVQLPAEDEFALCNTTFRSPLLRYVFPRQAERYERYYTFRGVREHSVAVWKQSFLTFLKKLTWKYDRPLVLKSPPHTARVRLLLELFPDARFVHIHREPYAVFQSTKHLDQLALESYRLQHSHDDLDEDILRVYREMYDAFFADRHLIPPGQFHEMAFEELESDPVGQLGRLYEALNLPGFGAVRPTLERYVGSLQGYRKNAFPELPAPLRTRIAAHWQRAFDEWGYPR